MQTTSSHCQCAILKLRGAIVLVVQKNSYILVKMLKFLRAVIRPFWIRFKRVYLWCYYKHQWHCCNIGLAWRNLRSRKYRFSLKRTGLSDERSVIVMLNNGEKYNGMTDRLYVIVAAYYYAKKHGLGFKIFCDGEFNWNTYFLPAQIDWRCSSDDITYSYPYDFPTRLPRKFCKLPGFPLHYHVYWCLSIRDVIGMLPVSEWCSLYRELFTPSDYAEKLLEADSLKSGAYIAIHTRFLNTLEQNEYKCLGVPLPEDERNKLIADVLTCIEAICAHYGDDVKIVCMGDSMLFNSIVKERLPRVLVSSSRVGHISHSSASIIHDAAVKDFLTISRSKKLYRIVLPPMYRSGYAIVAAHLGAVEQIEISSLSDIRCALRSVS